MEQSPYQRLELFWQSKGVKTPAAFADGIDGLSSSALSAMKQRRSTPSAVVMRSIQLAYPDINPDYILWGTGTMLRDGRALSQLPPALPPAVREGFPDTPGHATPQQADFVGKYIQRLEDDILGKDALIEWLQEQNQVLLGKSPASPDAAAFAAVFPRTEVLGFGRQPAAVEAKVLLLYPAAAEPVKEAA